MCHASTSYASDIRTKSKVIISQGLVGRLMCGRMDKRLGFVGLNALTTRTISPLICMPRRSREVVTVHIYCTNTSTQYSPRRVVSL